MLLHKIPYISRIVHVRYSLYSLRWFVARYGKVLLTCLSDGLQQVMTRSCFTAVVVVTALKPHSQQMQSNVHTFPSAGIRLIPKETPSRRLCIGPKIGDGYITVLMVRFFCMFLFVMQIYTLFLIPRRKQLFLSQIWASLQHESNTDNCKDTRWRN